MRLAKNRSELILASASPRRLRLLEQAGVKCHIQFAVDADETPAKAETPGSLAKRLAMEKAHLAIESVSRCQTTQTAFILTADTVVGLGRRILPKTETRSQAFTCMRTLSGRSHRVFTGVCLVNPEGKIRQRLVETRVRFKRLSHEEIEAYLASGEWRGKAGGYAIQGLAGSFIVKIIGSYTNIVGLPLRETIGLLVGEGYPAYREWSESRTLEHAV